MSFLCHSQFKDGAKKKDSEDLNNFPKVIKLNVRRVQVF